MKKVIKVISLFLISLLGGALGAILILKMNLSPLTGQQQTNTTQLTTHKSDNQTNTTVAVKVIQNAVVSVINYQPASNDNNLDNFYSQIFGGEPAGQLANDDEQLVVAGEGSGVIYKKSGGHAYLVTNNHVVENAKKLEILMANGNKVIGELVGSDVYSDLAVIKIPEDVVDTVGEFADSSSLNIGEVAIAIGSPLGSEYANSVTEGIVSSLSRVVTSQNENGQAISTNAIQTDAAINPGNSGGPLINIHGQIIGINSSKITVTNAQETRVAVEGMGFAIPSNDVVSIINQLEKDGAVQRPALGISMANLSKLSTAALDELGLPEGITGGVIVLEIQDNLPADGKLDVYDVITGIDGEPIDNSSDLQSVLYKHQIGDTITVTFYRGKEKKTVTIELTKTTLDLAVN